MLHKRAVLGLNTKLILSAFRILYDDIVVHFNGPFPLLVEPVWEGEKLLDLMVEP